VRRRWPLLFCAWLLLCAAPALRAGTALAVGSKAFAESHVLAEIAAQLLEHHGFAVERRLGLGGTLITYTALREGEIDLYPEYSGTLAQVILKQPGLQGDALRAAAAGERLSLAAQFGFNNSYALAAPRSLAQRLGLESISDLARYPDLRLGFSLEFLRREDGWPALRAHYALPQQALGMEHALAYPALQAGQLDITDAYTTDGELERYAITLLADDRGFFPAYDALLLARQDLPPEAARVLAQLDGRLDGATMRDLNRQVNQEGLSPRAVASGFLAATGLLPTERPGAATAPPGRWRRIAGHILTHLKLTGSALALACALAIPLALAASRLPRLARVLVYLCGLLQTIPALALLALLIPWLGLGAAPAVLALFLYSLLPIVRNTLTGIDSVDPLLRQVATGIGLGTWQRLWHIELPLALPTLLAGIRTAAIISIGTATLAAFVGAGGLGEPIITGLTLNDHRMILEGAIPAALLALLAELLFEGAERLLRPAPLRRRDASA
jgi:glycine betaine/choline ABC-type transport system substrate-binding protein/ABC-type proline/glycine betaine transport system permease subunit